MFDFLKRQLRTKTGKAAMAIIAGSIAAGVTGEASTSEAVQTGALSLLAMLLRDKEAKKEHNIRLR